MIIALTGGIGCGKSTALKIFSEMGWVVFDADQVCHELYLTHHDKLLSEFENRWGEGSVVDEYGSIDRQLVAEKVFSDKDELSWINGIFHPLIWEYAVDAMSTDADIVFDIPLLYEAEWDKKFDVIVAIWSPYEQQLKRLKSRGWSKHDIARRLNTQLAADDKLEKADYGIINNGNILDLKKQCIYLNKKLREI